MRLPSLVDRLPAHLINGISVALGVALVQAVVGTLGGFVAALTASSGAIFASLADVPVAPWRTVRRVATAAAVGTLASVLVTFVRPYAGWLGLATSVLAFVSALALAWGPRAGPISFVPILALVFTLAAPSPTALLPVLEHAGWTALGALLFVGWATAMSTLLQPRLRTLGLATALGGTSALLRSRAGLLTDFDRHAARGEPPLQAWIQRQAALDEQLQNARDLLFAVADLDSAAPAAGRARGWIVVLLLAIDLRDNLLASEVDLDLLGDGALADRVRQALSSNLHAMADTLERMAEAVRSGEPLDGQGGAEAGVDTLLFDPESLPGGRLPAIAQALVNRARNMRIDLGRMASVLAGAPAALPLDRAQLQLFVSPEGWPLATLRSHLTLASPVLRHALRVGFALGSAYYIAEALPWASHPHWLVLSVAVVLRGNLEQTIARRDARIAGTTIGCLLVALLAGVSTPTLSTVVFIVAVGVAHSFVMRRYLLTSIAATLMALLQAHLVHPEGGYGVAERLADTVLGALLAWGFSYMLPWWERRSVAALVPRVLAGLAALAAEALRWPEAERSDLQLRLARRSAYEAIGGIAAAAQRTTAEPQRVRVPLYALAGLLTRSHVLLAHLSAVRTLLARRSAELEPARAREALDTTAAELARLLSPDARAPFDDTSILRPEEDLLRPPPANDALTPWLQRRLHLTLQAAALVAEAARSLRATVV